ncbi:hypothetical protein TYRP_018986 [Tyrophagus putrescentiae]|nr:hypothetical protein TYRP_018986 [Tyrophagus putrescentiae]
MYSVFLMDDMDPTTAAIITPDRRFLALIMFALDILSALICCAFRMNVSCKSVGSFSAIFTDGFDMMAKIQ